MESASTDRNTNAAKFQPRSETLPPLSELNAIANVTNDDVDNAIEAWKDFVVNSSNENDNEFENLLTATDG